jgi:hypothetical protein
MQLFIPHLSLSYLLLFDTMILYYFYKFYFFVRNQFINYIAYWCQKHIKKRVISVHSVINFI